jgi:hypothetical protein
MLSCFFPSTPPAPPLFENPLLADPSIRLKETRWNAQYYDMLATATLIVFVAVAILGVSYCAVFAAEYVYHVVSAGVMLFPCYHSMFHVPYKTASIEASQQFALESLVERHIKKITATCTPLKKAEYLKSLHAEIGAKPLSTELEKDITSASKLTDPHEPLIPLYARALAYNDLANEKLQEISLVFLTPPKSLENRKVEELNYQELRTVQNDPSRTAEEKALGRYLHSNRLANWFNLENSYLDYRMSSVQIAHIASNPIASNPSFPGSIRQHFFENTDVVYIENLRRYENISGSNPFERRDSILDLHVNYALNLFYASLDRMQQTGPIKIDADLSDTLLPNLSDREWREINAVTCRFLHRHNISFNSEGVFKKSEIKNLLNWQGNQKDLLSDPSLTKFVHTATTSYLINQI